DIGAPFVEQFAGLDELADAAEVDVPVIARRQARDWLHLWLSAVQHLLERLLRHGNSLDAFDVDGALAAVAGFRMQQAMKLQRFRHRIGAGGDLVEAMLWVHELALHPGRTEDAVLSARGLAREAIEVEVEYLGFHHGEVRGLV